MLKRLHPMQCTDFGSMAFVEILSLRPGDERTAMDSFHHVGQQRQRHGPEPKLGIQILNIDTAFHLWAQAHFQRPGKFVSAKGQPNKRKNRIHSQGSQRTKVRIIENCAERYPTPGRIECLDVGKFGEPDAPHKVMVSKLPFAVQSLGSPS